MSQQHANIYVLMVYTCVCIYIHGIQKYAHDDDLITLMINNAGSLYSKSIQIRKYIHSGQSGL